MVTIGHASIDERGKARGGRAGDQTGREVCTRSWYNKPWIAVIRPKSAKVAEKIAKAMEQAAANDNIGYDQNERTTLFAQAKANGWDLSKIKTPCETDCSALVAVCVNAAGIAVSKDIYTGNEKAALLNTGEFTAYTAKKYIASADLLKRGDILLGSGHTAIVLKNTAGTTKTQPKQETPKAIGNVESAQKYDKSVAGTYKVIATALNLRTGAGTAKDKKVITEIPHGKSVTCYGYYNEVGGIKWLLVTYGSYTGFVSSKYLRK